MIAATFFSMIFAFPLGAPSRSIEVQGPVLAAGTCTAFDQQVRICDLPSHWIPSIPQPHAAAEYSRSDGFFAQIVLDQAGTDQGLTLQAASDAILTQMASNPSVGSFKLLVQGTNTNWLNESEIMIYSASFQGVPFVFANTVFVGRSKSVQVITWRVAQTLETKDRDAHLDFGSGLVLMPAF